MGKVLLHTGRGNNKWSQVICLGLLVFVSACTYGDTDRYSVKGEGKVFVSLDWKGQPLPSKTLYYFYPVGSNTPITRVGTGSGYEGVLPAGTYKVVVVNEDYRNIVLQTDKGYEQAYAYGVMANGTSVASTRTEAPSTILPPSNLYGTGLTSVAIDGANSKIYTAYPQALVHSVVLNISIKGMDEITTVEGTLTGVSPSVYIPSGEAVYQDLVAIPIPLEKAGDGNYHSTQNVFGLTPKSGTEQAGKNLLLLDITLSEGKTFRSELDITEVIDNAVNGGGIVSGGVTASIELELVVDTSRPEGVRVNLVGWHTGSGSAGEDSKEDAK